LQKDFGFCFLLSAFFPTAQKAEAEAQAERRFSRCLQLLGLRLISFRAFSNDCWHGALLRTVFRTTRSSSAMACAMLARSAPRPISCIESSCIKLSALCLPATMVCGNRFAGAAHLRARAARVAHEGKRAK
jgi:hypothetical protein